MLILAAPDRHGETSGRCDSVQSTRRSAERRLRRGFDVSSAAVVPAGANAQGAGTNNTNVMCARWDRYPSVRGLGYGFRPRYRFGRDDDESELRVGGKTWRLMLAVNAASDRDFSHKSRCPLRSHLICGRYHSASQTRADWRDRSSSRQVPVWLVFAIAALVCGWSPRPC